MDTSKFNTLVKASLPVVEKALAELESAGVNAYVIDVRQNKGGAFQSSVEISSLFTEGQVATYRYVVIELLNCHSNGIPFVSELIH